MADAAALAQIPLDPAPCILPSYNAGVIFANYAMWRIMELRNTKYGRTLALHTVDLPNGEDSDPVFHCIQVGNLHVAADWGGQREAAPVRFTQLSMNSSGSVRAATVAHRLVHCPSAG